MQKCSADTGEGKRRKSKQFSIGPEAGSDGLGPWSEAGGGCKSLTRRHDNCMKDMSDVIFQEGTGNRSHQWALANCFADFTSYSPHNILVGQR